MAGDDLLLPTSTAAVPDADWWTKLGKYMPTGAFMVSHQNQ